MLRTLYWDWRAAGAARGEWGGEEGRGEGESTRGTQQRRAPQTPAVAGRAQCVSPPEAARLTSSLGSAAEAAAGAAAKPRVSGGKPPGPKGDLPRERGEKLLAAATTEGASNDETAVGLSHAASPSARTKRPTARRAIALLALPPTRELASLQDQHNMVLL